MKKYSVVEDWLFYFACEIRVNLSWLYWNLKFCLFTQQVTKLCWVPRRTYIFCFIEKHKLCYRHLKFSGMNWKFCNLHIICLNLVNYAIFHSNIKNFALATFHNSKTCQLVMWGRSTGDSIQKKYLGILYPRRGIWARFLIQLWHQ